MANLTQPRKQLSISDPWVKTFTYYIAFIALGLTSASLGPTLPGLASSTGSDIGRISFLFVLRSLGYLLGSFSAGRLYDKRPGNPVIGFSLVMIAGLLITVPVIPVLWILAAVLLFIGIAEGTVDVGGNTLLVWLHRDKVGPFMNGLHFTFGIGALLSPIIVAQSIILTGGIQWAYWALAILIVPIAAWVFRMPSPPPQVLDKTEAIKPAQPVLVVLILLFFFLYVGGEVGFGGWIYTYAISTGLGTETSAAYLNSMFWGALTASRLVAIPISTKLKPGVILLTNLIGCLLSIVLILLIPGSAAILWIGTIGTGIFMASIFPTMLNLAQQKMTITGRVTSWFFVGASAGGMVLPWIVGQFIEPVGPQTVMLAIFISLSLALVLFGSIVLFNGRQPSPAPSSPTSGNLP
jgi:fucose permease